MNRFGKAKLWLVCVLGALAILFLAFIFGDSLSRIGPVDR
jgi:hypothetical protein